MPITFTSRLSLASPASAADGRCPEPFSLLLCYTVVLPLNSPSFFVLLSLFVVVVPRPALARRANRAAGTTRHG